MTLTWHSAELSDNRHNIVVASANGKVLFLGGNYSRQIDIYDALTGKWSLTQLSQGVNGVAATSSGNKCGFMGFLYGQGLFGQEKIISNGAGLNNTAILITP